MAYLEENDFQEGVFTACGYNNLKEQCQYIPYKEQIVIKVPSKHVDSFKESLESMAAVELRKNKKDRIFTLLMGLVLVLIGASFYMIHFFLSHVSVLVDFSLLGTWVFTWTAINKAVFDHLKLQDKRFSILHMASADVVEIQ